MLHLAMESSNHMDTLTQTNGKETATVTTTVAVPESLWKRVRNMATERRVSANSLWLQAMTEFLERQGG